MNKIYFEVEGDVVIKKFDTMGLLYELGKVVKNDN